MFPGSAAGGVAQRAHALPRTACGRREATEAARLLTGTGSASCTRRARTARVRRVRQAEAAVAAAETARDATLLKLRSPAPARPPTSPTSSAAKAHRAYADKSTEPESTRFPDDAWLWPTCCSVTVSVGKLVGETPAHNVTRGPSLKVPTGTRVPAAFFSHAS
jgi:hypothetical protein